MEPAEAELKMLMVAGIAGDAQAHRQLLTAAGRRLSAYFARRLGKDCADVEDLVQDVLIAIHQRRASYDPALPFTAWLHAIARYKRRRPARLKRLQRGSQPGEDQRRRNRSAQQQAAL